MLATPDQQISLTDPDARSMATRSVSPVVGYLTHNDQMMVGLHGNLNVVTTPEPRPLVAIERASGMVSDICWSGVASISTLRRSTPHLLQSRRSGEGSRWRGTP